MKVYGVLTSEQGILHRNSHSLSFKSEIDKVKSGFILNEDCKLDGQIITAEYYDDEIAKELADMLNEYFD